MRKLQDKYVTNVNILETSTWYLLLHLALVSVISFTSVSINSKVIKRQTINKVYHH